MNRSEYTLLVSGSVVASIFLIAYLASGHATHPLTEVASDSYAPLAQALYETRTFTLSTTTPYVLEATHVPGYPIFLALTAAPFGNVVPALVLQILLFAVTGVLLYRLFEGVFEERVRFYGALLFVVEPYTAFTAAQPLSEALFLFLLISGLVVGRRAIERQRMRNFFLAGILLGAATLTRPILLYALPILIVAMGVIVYHKSIVHTYRATLMSVLALALVITPWAYRNHEAFGVWTLSTKGAYTLYFYDAALVLQYRDHLTPSAVSAELLARATAQYPEVQSIGDLRSPRYADFMTAEALSIIGTAPALFIKMYTASIVTYFLSDGYRLLWYEFSDGAITLPNITKAIATGDMGVVGDYLIAHPLQALFLFAGLIFWGGVLLLAGVSLFFALRQRRSHIVVVACVAAILYFAILTGPVAQARYRVVATPFLFVLAAAGGAILRERFRRAPYAPRPN